MKNLMHQEIFNQGFYKKRWRVFFSHLRQNIIDDVLSFQGHSCWLPSSHTVWPHQTLSEVHLEIDFGRKGWKAASSLVLSYKWIFCQQLFSSINSRQGKDFKQYVWTCFLFCSELMYTVESSLFVGDQCSLSLWVTLAYKFTSPQMYLYIQSFV